MSGSIEATYDGGDHPPLVEIIPDRVEEAREEETKEDRLREIVNAGPLEAVRKALDQRMDPNWALSCGPKDAAIVGLLIDRGAKVDGSDERRPLRWAAQFGYLEACRCLLDRGADPNALDGLLRTAPLAMAALHNHARIVEFLLERGADPNLGEVLQSAVSNNGRARPAILAVLLAAGARVDDAVLEWAKKKGREAELGTALLGGMGPARTKRSIEDD